MTDTQNAKHKSDENGGKYPECNMIVTKMALKIVQNSQNATKSDEVGTKIFYFSHRNRARNTL